MKDQVEIITNTGKSRMVSKEFAEAFNRAKEHNKSLPNSFGELNDIPVEEFEEESEVEKSILGEENKTNVSDLLGNVLDKPKKENEIKGGKADNLSINDIAKKHKVSVEKIKSQLIMGIKVEMEHTTSPKKALEIAMDHLTESPEYYTKLKKMEESF